MKLSSLLNINTSSHLITFFNAGSFLQLQFNPSSRKGAGANLLTLIFGGVAFFSLPGVAANIKIILHHS